MVPGVPSRALRVYKYPLRLSTGPPIARDGWSLLGHYRALGQVSDRDSGMKGCSWKRAGGVPGVQMRALQAMAVSRPPPRAMDSTAATVGLGPLSSSVQKLSLILQAGCAACQGEAVAGASTALGTHCCSSVRQTLSMRPILLLAPERPGLPPCLTAAHRSQC